VEIDEPVPALDELDLESPVDEGFSSQDLPPEAIESASAEAFAPQATVEEFTEAGTSGDAIPDLTADVAAAEAADPFVGGDLRIPGLRFFDGGASAPGFVGGMPLVLNELAAPPSTFGARAGFVRRRASPARALTDDDEPGPFIR